MSAASGDAEPAARVLPAGHARNLNDLPVEVQQMIATGLSPRDLLAFADVCRASRAGASETLFEDACMLLGASKTAGLRLFNWRSLLRAVDGHPERCGEKACKASRWPAGTAPEFILDDVEVGDLLAVRDEVAEANLLAQASAGGPAGSATSSRRHNTLPAPPPLPAVHPFLADLGGARVRQFAHGYFARDAGHARTCENEVVCADTVDRNRRRERVERVERARQARLASAAARSGTTPASSSGTGGAGDSAAPFGGRASLERDEGAQRSARTAPSRDTRGGMQSVPRARVRTAGASDRSASGNAEDGAGAPNRDGADGLSGGGEGTHAGGGCDGNDGRADSGGQETNVLQRASPLASPVARLSPDDAPRHAPTQPTAEVVDHADSQQPGEAVPVADAPAASPPVSGTLAPSCVSETAADSTASSTAAPTAERLTRAAARKTGRVVEPVPLDPLAPSTSPRQPRRAPPPRFPNERDSCLAKIVDHPVLQHALATSPALQVFTVVVSQHKWEISFLVENEHGVTIGDVRAALKHWLVHKVDDADIEGWNFKPVKAPKRKDKRGHASRPVQEKLVPTGSEVLDWLVSKRRGGRWPVNAREGGWWHARMVQKADQLCLALSPDARKWATTQWQARPRSHLSSGWNGIPAPGFYSDDYDDYSGSDDMSGLYGGGDPRGSSWGGSSGLGSGDDHDARSDRDEGAADIKEEVDENDADDGEDMDDGGDDAMYDDL